MGTMVLILNADYSPMTHVTVEHAFRMWCRGVATIEEEHPTITYSGIPVPTKVRLLRYVNMGWYYAKPVHWSKRGILLRDRYRCVYCNARADTIDHLVPSSKGGKSTWTNTVAACFKCNQKKNDHSLEEMGWTLSEAPRAPTRTELAILKIEFIEQKNAR